MRPTEPRSGQVRGPAWSRCCALLLVTLTLACSGPSTSPPPPPPEDDAGTPEQPTEVAVAVRAPATRVVAGGALRLEATVTGAVDPSLLWTVGGVAGGSVELGTVDASGLFTAPATVPAPAAVLVRATSVEDSTAFAEVELTVVEAAVSGLLARYSDGTLRVEGPIAHGTEPACTDTGGHAYQGACVPAASAPLDWVGARGFSVEWIGFLRVPSAGTYHLESDGALGGALRVEVDGVVVADVAAPGAPWQASVTLEAGRVPVALRFTAADAPSRVRFGWRGPDGAVVPVPRAHLEPRVGVTASTGAETLAAGGTLDVSAAVLGSLDPAVTWSLEAGTCGAEAGSVSATGHYSAGNPSSTCEVTLVATSAADPTATARVVVTVTGAPPAPPVELARTVAGFGPRRLAVDAAGNALAAWVDYAIPATAWVARYDAAAGTWGAPFGLHPAVGNRGARDVVLAGNAAGRVVLVWTQAYEVGGVTKPTELRAATYELATGVLSAASVLTATGTVMFPAVAVNAQGSALVAWCRDPYFGARTMYGAALRTWGGTWTVAERLDADDPDVGWGGSSPSFADWSGVVVDAAGNGTALWQHHSDVTWSVRSNRFLAATGSWEGERVVAPGSATSNFGSEQLVALPGNEVLALWRAGQASTDPERIDSAVLNPATGQWSSPPVTVYQAARMDNGSLRTAADAQGRVVAAWTENVIASGTATVHLFGITRTAAGAWSTPARLDTLAGNAGQPVVAAGAGRLLVAWNQGAVGSVQREPRAVRFDLPTGAWTSPTRLAPGLTGEPHDGMSLAVDGNGGARLLWVQFPALLSLRLPGL